jgi:hypothetical protein
MSVDVITLAKELALVRQRVEQLEQQQQKTHGAVFWQGGTPAADSEARAESESNEQKQNKKARRDSKDSPLDKDEVLDTVFSYVGIGDYFYTAAVCSNWRRRYLKLCYTEARKKDDCRLTAAAGTAIAAGAAGAAAAIAVASAKCTTSYRSAMMTSARLRLSLQDSVTVVQLQANKQQFARDVVCYSQEPREVLSLLKLHDMVWHSELCIIAVYRSKLQLLQWLHECGCPWQVPLLLKNAAMKGHLDVLKWMYKVTGPWSAALATYVLCTAAYDNRLEVVEWLYAQGAEWPQQLHAAAEYHGRPINVCWTAHVVRWALAHGCTWGNWQCQQLATDRYNEGYRRDRATELFAWAHQNGCPCTCETAANTA